MLGPQGSGGSNRSFGEYLKDKFTGAWESRPEEWKIDLVLSQHEQAKWIGLDDAESYALEDFQPALYDVLIEHESNCGLSYQEMLKLAYIRARLKVLITYNHDSDGSDPQEAKAKNELARVLKQFAHVVRGSNAHYPENSTTEYVLVMGRLRNDQPGIEWKYFCSRPEGVFSEMS